MPRRMRKLSLMRRVLRNAAGEIEQEPASHVALHPDQMRDIVHGTVVRVPESIQTFVWQDLLPAWAPSHRQGRLLQDPTLVVVGSYRAMNSSIGIPMETVGGVIP